jgi:DNA-binding response OmpR family regulator
MNKQPRFLIAESSSIIADDLKRLLCHWDMGRFDVAGTLQGAVRTLEKKHPDVVIFDAMLKGCKDGIKTAIHIMEDYQVSIILLTDCMNSEMRLYRRLFDSFFPLMKPFVAQELKLLVDFILLNHEKDNERMKYMNPVKVAHTG